MVLNTFLSLHLMYQQTYLQKFTYSRERLQLSFCYCYIFFLLNSLFFSFIECSRNEVYYHLSEFRISCFLPISNAVDRISCEVIGTPLPLFTLWCFFCLLRPVFQIYVLATLTFRGKFPLDTLTYFAENVLLLGSATFFGTGSLLKSMLFISTPYSSAISSIFYMFSATKNIFINTL